MDVIDAAEDDGCMRFAVLAGRRRTLFEGDRVKLPARSSRTGCCGIGRTYSNGGLIPSRLLRARHQLVGGEVRNVQHSVPAGSGT